jgi:hypothetical protein
MTSALKGIVFMVAALAVFSLSASRDVSGHGRELRKKACAAAAVEVGPHGGAVIDVGDGHFELVRNAAGALSLYRLDTELKAIPAEGVDGAQVCAVMPGGKTVKLIMTPVRNEFQPLYFSVNPNIAQRGGYLAIVSISMGEESPRNLRFQVKGN